jgi:transcription elongation GreA/GreB family factor
LGRALLGKEVDSEIEIDSPQGRKLYFVLAIAY